MILSIFRRTNKYYKVNSKIIYRRKNVAILKAFAVLLVIFCVLVFLRSELRGRGVDKDLLAKILFSEKFEEILLEQQIEDDLKKQVPGLGDRGVATLLSGEEKISGELSLQRHGINFVLSEHISYNRTPPDILHNKCKAIEYNNKDLPKASVVIIFYDEPYSVLLRTIHSVLNTSPPELLQEIILVDDFSNFEDLKGKLSHYIKTRLPKNVKILRLPKQ